MKRITLLVMFIYTLIFADLDKNAYTKYIKTSQYQIASAKPTGNLFTNLYSTYSKEDNILNWRVTLKKIEDLTGNSTSFGAIAKAYHKNFLYLTLTPVLKDSHNNEICRCTTIQRKIMFGKSNKVSFSSIVPSNITPHSVIIDFGLNVDKFKNTISLKKPKDKVSKEARQLQKQKIEQYRKEVQTLNESVGIKEFLEELKKDELSKKSSSSDNPITEKQEHATNKSKCYYYENLSNKSVRRINSKVSSGNVKPSLEEIKRSKEYTIRAIRECKPYGDVSNLEAILDILNSAGY